MKDYPIGFEGKYSSDWNMSGTERLWDELN